MLQQGTEGLRGLGQIVERIQDPRELELGYVLAPCRRALGLREGSMPGVGRGGGGQKTSWGEGVQSRKLEGSDALAGVKHYMGGRLWIRQGGESRSKAGRETFG